MSSKDQIKQLLVAGQTPALIAEQVGVDRAYISHLLKDEDFKRSIQVEMAARMGVRLEIDDLTDGLELKALGLLEQQMEDGTFADKPHLTLAAIKTLGSRKRTSAAAHNGGQSGNTIINLNLPSFLVQQGEEQEKVIVNDNNEVTAINDRVLKTVGTGKLMSHAEKQLEERRKSRELKNMISNLDDDEAEDLFS